MAMQEPVFPSDKFVQTEFFVPGTTTNETAHKQWNEFAAQAAVACTDRKVQRLEFDSNGKPYVAEVGYLINDESSTWLVTAIFEPHGKSINDPWAIALLRIRNGEVVTRKPAWLVAQRAINRAFDFSPPALEEHSDTQGDA